MADQVNSDDDASLKSAEIDEFYEEPVQLEDFPP
jgi:hypothetical protein